MKPIISRAWRLDQKAEGIAPQPSLSPSDLTSGTAAKIILETIHPSADGIDLKLNEVFKRIEKRFSLPKPVMKNEIEEMYKNIFNNFFRARIGLYLNNPNHIASIVHSLYSVIQFWKQSPTSVLISTKDSKEKGTNGSFFVKDALGHSQWVFKPAALESSVLAAGIPEKEGILREHLAHVVNEDRIYPIPFTACVDLFGEIGSLQRIVPGKSLELLRQEALGGIETNKSQKALYNISTKDVQAKLIFDIIFGNMDGHEANIICMQMGREGAVGLRSIDHGNICSEAADVPCLFAYIKMKQCSDVLDKGLTDHCRALPIDRYAFLMKQQGIGERAINNMKTRAYWLKFGLSRGLSLREVALPLILKPELIHSFPVKIDKLASEILELRASAYTACRTGVWTEFSERIRSFRRGVDKAQLLKGDDVFYSLWHNYLKPMFLEDPSRKAASEIFRIKLTEMM